VRFFRRGGGLTPWWPRIRLTLYRVGDRLPSWLRCCERAQRGRKLFSRGAGRASMKRGTVPGCSGYPSRCVRDGSFGGCSASRITRRWVRSSPREMGCGATYTSAGGNYNAATALQTPTSACSLPIPIFGSDVNGPLQRAHRSSQPPFGEYLANRRRTGPACCPGCSPPSKTRSVMRAPAVRRGFAPRSRSRRPPRCQAL